MKYPRKVYAFRHNDTGRVYVGSSVDVKKRMAQHRSNLRCHRHNVEDLQADYDKYGDNINVIILDEIKDESEDYKEYDWMRVYGTRERGKGYNYKDKPPSAIRKQMNESQKAGMREWLRLWIEIMQLPSERFYEVVEALPPMRFTRPSFD